MILNRRNSTLCIIWYFALPDTTTRGNQGLSGIPTHAPPGLLHLSPAHTEWEGAANHHEGSVLCVPFSLLFNRSKNVPTRYHIDFVFYIAFFYLQYFLSLKYYNATSSTYQTWTMTSTTNKRGCWRRRWISCLGTPSLSTVGTTPPRGGPRPLWVYFHLSCVALCKSLLSWPVLSFVSCFFSWPILPSMAFFSLGLCWVFWTLLWCLILACMRSFTMVFYVIA